MPSYKDTLGYLNSLTNYELTGIGPGAIKFNLGKLRKVLKGMGNPHRDYFSVHVTGTKGKGSICSFTSCMLKEAGYRVGLFTSPHLDTARERIKVDGKIISKKDFADVAELLRKYIDPGKAFTYFEVLTLMAMLHFSRKKVDYAIFEVGMGGRFDATNVLNAKVCGIGPVSYDHTYALGNTIKKITREKAEIIKRRAHCVSSPQRTSALEVIKEKCLEENASLSLVGKDLTYELVELDEGGSRFNVRGKKGRYEDCRVNMPGIFQVENCVTAIGICEKLGTRIKGLDEGIIKRGIEKAFIPGRLEVLAREPLVVIDGSQNEESARRLKSSVERIFKYNKLILILGLSKDKDIRGTCRQLASMADEIVFTRASCERAADPLLIRGYIKGKPARVTRDVKEALGVALKKAKKGDMILATGSFYVIGEVRKMLKVQV
ncbi:MAG: bifunctional folylpolyglutamate synthase/dihydrofolate synthase [Candidatus Omnitrophota bacterium]